MSIPVPDMPDRLLIDFATRCNLRCPMCPVWGLEDEKIDPLKGAMALDKARRLLDEFTIKKPMVAPSIYGEPLLIPNMREVFREVKARGMALALNTNGLNLHHGIAEFFVEIGVDSVMVSLDAHTRETYEVVRGVDRLLNARLSVRVLQAARHIKRAEHPRIGVSFTVQDENRHELERFVKRWVGEVDVVRIGNVFKHGKFQGMQEPAERIPCPVLYKTMAVHHDGSVRMCCLDGERATDMGNVFEEGAHAVWHGEKFTEARRAHEAGEWDKVPFCKGCNGWAADSYEEEIKDGILIRRSPEFTYYNTIERLGNWQGNLLGGHKAP